jgi:hypothetical protein
MLPRQPAYMDDGGCLWLQFVMHQWRRPADRPLAVNSCSEPAAGDDGGSPKSLTVELWSNRAWRATSRDDSASWSPAAWPAAAAQIEPEDWFAAERETRATFAAIYADMLGRP